MNNNMDISVFSTATWEQASETDRKQYLQKLEKFYAKKQGRKWCEIIFEEMPAPPGRIKYSRYDFKDGKIYINTMLIEESGYKYDVVETVIHEGRHAYQHHVISNPEEYPDLAWEVMLWLKNMLGYISQAAAGNTAYLYFLQAKERDANLYALDEMKNIFEPMHEAEFGKYVQYIENELQFECRQAKSRNINISKIDAVVEKKFWEEWPKIKDTKVGRDYQILDCILEPPKVKLENIHVPHEGSLCHLQGKINPNINLNQFAAMLGVSPQSIIEGEGSTLLIDITQIYKEHPGRIWGAIKWYNEQRVIREYAPKFEREDGVIAASVVLGQQNNQQQTVNHVLKPAAKAVNRTEVVANREVPLQRQQVTVGRLFTTFLEHKNEISKEIYALSLEHERYKGDPLTIEQARKQAASEYVKGEDKRLEQQLKELAVKSDQLIAAEKEIVDFAKEYRLDHPVWKYIPGFAKGERLKYYEMQQKSLSERRQALECQEIEINSKLERLQQRIETPEAQFEIEKNIPLVVEKDKQRLEKLAGLEETMDVLENEKQDIDKMICILPARAWRKNITIDGDIKDVSNLLRQSEQLAWQARELNNSTQHQHGHQANYHGASLTR